MLYLVFALVISLGYLSGSIPVGYLLARLKGHNILQEGSGNIRSDSRCSKRLYSRITAAVPLTKSRNFYLLAVRNCHAGFPYRNRHDRRSHLAVYSWISRGKRSGNWSWDDTGTKFPFCRYDDHSCNRCLRILDSDNPDYPLPLPGIHDRRSGLCSGISLHRSRPF